MTEDLTTAQAAAVLGVSEAAVRWYVRKGLLAHRRHGKRTLVFSRVDVEAFTRPLRTGRPKGSKNRKRR